MASPALKPALSVSWQLAWAVWQKRGTDANTAMKSTTRAPRKSWDKASVPDAVAARRMDFIMPATRLSANHEPEMKENRSSCLSAY